MAKDEKEEKIVEKKEKKIVEKKEEIKVVTVVFKTNLHCPQCARDIREPLLRHPGVHSVDVKFEKGEITVKGTFDEKKVHKRIEKLSRKKVEILKKEEEKAAKETKVTVKTTTIKVYMHCEECENELRRKLLKRKGIHNVKTDRKAQTITIETSVESDKILTYLKKRVHKHAEIIPPKEEKKEKEKEKKEEKKEKEVIVEVKTKETTTVVEFTEEKKVNAKTPEGKVPYFVHYVYAPQLFSDENPNACSIM